jgi:hypothetical protein
MRLILIAALASCAFASDRGAVIYQESFSGSEMPKAWAGKPGKWEMEGGAIKASEVPEDKHAAVRRHPLQYHDAIFEFSFQFDGSRMIALSLNNKGGHVCRLSLSPNGAILQVDQPNAKSDQKAVRLAASTTKIAPGTWHKAVVEVHGAKMTAQIDDMPPITGENPRVDVDKTDLGFAVAGVSGRIKGLKVFDIK